MLTNKQIIDAIVAKFPSFIEQTAQDPYKLLTERGFEEINLSNADYVNDFFGLITRVWLQLVNISHAKNPLEEAGFGEYFDKPYGEVVQRMSINSVKPVNPAWVNLQDGDSVDPFIVRKPTVNERFYPQNFNYQSMITIPDDFSFKNMFVSSYGIAEFMGGIMEGLQNGYTLQQYTMTKEAINSAINPTKYTLKPTQIVETSLSLSNTTVETLKDFILKVNNIVTLMKIDPQSSAFNSYGFETIQNVNRLKLLVRVGIRSALNVNVLSTAFNPSKLNLPVDVIEVSDFGGLIPYQDAEFTTQLYPVYTKYGEMIGYNTEENATEVTVKTDEAYMKDPNENVVALLADKGLVFYTKQNRYTVKPIYNPRGLYTNYFASSPNNGVNIDATYNMVVFKTTTESL